MTYLEEEHKMSRTQTRFRNGRETSRSPSRNSQIHSPLGSLNLHNDKNLPVRELKVSITRLEMTKGLNNSTKLNGAIMDETKKLSNGSATQSGLRSLKSRRSIRTMTNSPKAELEYTTSTLRNSNKIAVTPSSIPRPRYSKTIDTSSSDEDAQNNVKIKRMTDWNLSEPQEWAGSFGALLLTLSMPICIPLLQVACTNDHCGLKNFRIPGLNEWISYFDRDAFLLYAGYLCYLAIMSLLPIGKLVAGQQSKSGTLKYRINGLWTLFLASAVFGGFVYQGYPVHDYLIKNSIQLTIAGLVYGLILSIILYVKADWIPLSNLNEYGSTRSFIYNFWQGREVNPRIGPIDVKQVLFKSTVIATDLINLAAAVKILKEADSLHWSNLDNLNVTALTVIGLQTIFFVDKLIFEARFFSSFEMTYEGLGYMLSTGYLIYPYISTLSTRYLLVHKIQLPSYLIAIWTVVFFVGYYLYRGSNNQKDEFRKNPFSPAVSHLETIPTPAGKRLLVSGFWGYVRRPNYLGDILMHLAWAFLGFAPDIMPYVLAIFTTLLLVHRAIRDEARCEKRYRFAWKQYCERVQYIIFPPVF